MLLLASTADLLRIATSSTSALDVQVNGMDMNVTTSERPTAYRRNTTISSATTTSIALSPASADIIRNIRTVTARNRGGSTNVVTALHTDGTTAVECFEAALAPDWSLQYEDGVGWWVTDSQGRQVVMNLQGAGSPVTDSDSIVRLASDVTNNNATANTMQDVTGLSFAVLANKLYQFKFEIVYTAAATGTGSRWSISGPASPTYLNYESRYSLTATTVTPNPHLQGYDLPAASNASSATTGSNRAVIEGHIQPAADGTVIARFASEVLSSAIVAKANSFVRYRQITP